MMLNKISKKNNRKKNRRNINKHKKTQRNNNSHKHKLITKKQKSTKGTKKIQQVLSGGDFGYSPLITGLVISGMVALAFFVVFSFLYCIWESIKAGEEGDRIRARRQRLLDSITGTGIQHAPYGADNYMDRRMDRIMDRSETQSQQITRQVNSSKGRPFIMIKTATKKTAAREKTAATKKTAAREKTAAAKKTAPEKAAAAAEKTAAEKAADKQEKADIQAALETSKKEAIAAAEAAKQAWETTQKIATALPFRSENKMSMLTEAKRLRQEWEIKEGIVNGLKAAREKEDAGLQAALETSKQEAIAAAEAAKEAWQNIQKIATALPFLSENKMSMLTEAKRLRQEWEIKEGIVNGLKDNPVQVGGDPSKVLLDEVSVVISYETTEQLYKRINRRLNIINGLFWTLYHFPSLKTTIISIAVNPFLSTKKENTSSIKDVTSAFLDLITNWNKQPNKAEKIILLKDKLDSLKTYNFNYGGLFFRTFQRAYEMLSRKPITEEQKQEALSKLIKVKITLSKSSKSRESSKSHEFMPINLKALFEYRKILPATTEVPGITNAGIALNTDSI